MVGAHDDKLQSRIDSAVETARDAHQALASIEDDVRAEQGGALGRLEQVLSYAMVVLERTDGVLVSDSTFQTLNSALGKIRDQITAQPQAADSWADETLDALARMPVARDQELAQAVKDAAANFQRSAAQRLRAIETKADGIEGNLASTESKITEAKAEIDTAFAERRAEADKLVTEMRNAVEESRTRIDSVETEQRDLFRKAQDERSDTFREQAESALADFKSERQTAAAVADETLNEMREHERKTRELVQVIGDMGTGGRYGLEVKAQKRQADIWRWLTVIAVAAAVGIAFWAASRAGGASDPMFISKIVITVLLGGLATYTARQSSRHRQREESARALELDMAAFPAFIEHLDPEKQQAAREMMLQVSFGRPLVPPDHQGEGGPSLFERILAARSRASDTSTTPE